MEGTGASIAFEQVVGDLVQPLARYLRRLAGDDAAAEDLLQETLIRVAGGLSAFDGRSTLRTWAFTIATRVAADHFRRPHLRLQTIDMEAGDEVEQVPAEDMAADDKLVEDEMTACIHGLVNRLPDGYRAALVLHDLEDMSVAEVAEICNLSVATAKIRIHRARKRLRAAMEDGCHLYHDRRDRFMCERKG